MRVKFAYAVSIAAAVAMATACGKKEDGEAGSGGIGGELRRRAAAVAAAPASAATVVKIGHVAPLTGGIAHLGKDNENGARLAVEEINAQGLTIDGHEDQAANSTHKTTRPTRAREPKRSPETRRRPGRRGGRPLEFGRVDSGIEDL